ncbi:UDP-N-acetylglucosamine--N-acetylmuramyl-(pentapeptide) pyrophosphoryl-undecaprenol N-acetylglucosamine transferase [bacterium]|nr:UDP-N-acetylglucosamine--N-acetylmuramyl-(pentapeptide) pyrophosphoryl-undecaprenol N-acetylglucosamine transferase [bacterium]
MIRVILSGGGTGGSVSPLLAIAQEIKRTRPETDFLFIGTRKGNPEKTMIKSFPYIKYQSIFSGKLRRYFSLRNFTDLFLILKGFFQSFFIILKFKPQAVLSAGAFVSVPLAWAAWILNVPVFIHQQDIRPGLANKLMAKISRKITVSFKKSLESFALNKTILTGNPVSPKILTGDKEKAIKRFNLKSNLPCLLIMGGGTGALEINQAIEEIIPDLVKFCQVVHLTGLQKGIGKFIHSHYHQIEFLPQEGLADIYAVADLVVSRAGLGALTELSVLKKPAIIIPITNSHQEANAKYFAKQKAIVLLRGKKINSQELLSKIKELILDNKQRALLSLNISQLASIEASKKISKVVLENIST